MSTTAIAKIDCQALYHNLAEIKRLMPSQKILPMIKGNAYGHGLVAVAKVFKNEAALGVANLDEALKLRNNGFVNNTIVVMRGFSNEQELLVFMQDEFLIPCIHDPAQLALLKSAMVSRNVELRVWLKLDTGMHRLGFSIDDFHDSYKQLLAIPNLIVAKVFSHLADADNIDSTFTDLQLKRFSQAVGDLPVEKGILNTAGILAYPEAGYDWVRPGIALYGGSPFPFVSSLNTTMSAFKPVMTLVSRIIAVKRLLPGETVGYNCTYRADKEMKIAVVGIGYADGYPRHAKSGAPVVINGQRCCMVGRVSMDMITVDISSLKNAAVGDEVILWGHELVGIDEIAMCASSIPHEVLTRVTDRVSYVYSD